MCCKMLNHEMFFYCVECVLCVFVEYSLLTRLNISRSQFASCAKMDSDEFTLNKEDVLNVLKMFRLLKCNY